MWTEELNVKVPDGAWGLQAGILCTWTIGCLQRDFFLRLRSNLLLIWKDFIEELLYIHKQCVSRHSVSKIL